MIGYLVGWSVCGPSVGSLAVCLLGGRSVNHSTDTCCDIAAVSIRFHVECTIRQASHEVTSVNECCAFYFVSSSVSSDDNSCVNSLWEITWFNQSPYLASTFLIFPRLHRLTAGTACDNKLTVPCLSIRVTNNMVIMVVYRVLYILTDRRLDRNGSIRRSVT